MIRAITMAYELGFQDVQDYYDTPGTWITFDFDNHPEMQVGIMTFTNGKQAGAKGGLRGLRGKLRGFLICNLGFLGCFLLDLFLWLSVF